MGQDQIANFLNTNPSVMWGYMLWVLVWKGTALWKAASKKQVTWFSLILFFNTVGVFEALYIFFLSKYDFGSAQVLARLKSTFKKG